MSFAKGFRETIFNINEENFENHCLELFEYQFRTCDIYHQYCSHLKKHPQNVHSLTDIPFLPIECFKNHAIKSGNWETVKVFKSSGTTSKNRSQHHIRDLSFYHQVTFSIAEKFFGELHKLQLVALLPSYQEQGDSSLIEMVDHFMKTCKEGSGYFTSQKKDLPDVLSNPQHTKLLFGVSYALLDLASSHAMPLPNTLVMETGGMKGRRKEITRDELHGQLKKAFSQQTIYSEYGMTELMSQAYGKEGIFRFPPWAGILIRDVNDPFSFLNKGKAGGINVIDLANVDSCAFIETKDLGRLKEDGFEVLGRFDNSDIRGCNLMI